MFAIGIVGFICLAILGAWLLLQFELAEITLILILLSVTGLGIYWTVTGGWGTQSAKGIGIFALLVLLLGFIRLGIEKLTGLLTRKSRSLRDSHP